MGTAITGRKRNRNGSVSRRVVLGSLTAIRGFAAEGGQEPELWRLVTHIDGDQRIEMDRIHVMLARTDDATGR
ncbi:hypothetical protein [Isoptericola variabilis]|uniref:hypothetical protein n=1 Tax=Isoptericola variabilis TaxID=139208 RepID=UPI00059BCBB2|nr:hypothetical protein [Isoptericola variabilis]TWH32393.1 hypothetical protein L600_001800000500 [Isoptericola variabilis J7]